MQTHFQLSPRTPTLRFSSKTPEKPPLKEETPPTSEKATKDAGSKPASSTNSSWFSGLTQLATTVTATVEKTVAQTGDMLTNIVTKPSETAGEITGAVLTQAEKVKDAAQDTLQRGQNAWDNAKEQMVEDAKALPGELPKISIASFGFKPLGIILAGIHFKKSAEKLVEGALKSTQQPPTPQPETKTENQPAGGTPPHKE
ncbi:MAG: hypothetical protein K2X66_18025 [Cyanobacteria bacterium]|nr:hypothetical protein [Cyanobacteriota bacterium]